VNDWASLWRRARAVDPLVVDAALAVGLLAIVLGEIAVTTPGLSTRDWLWNGLFIPTQTLPLAARRRYPFAVFLVTGLSAAVYNAVNIAPQPATELLPLLLALYTVAAYGRRSLAVIAGVLVAGGFLGVSIPTIDRGEVGNTISQFLIIAGAWILGDNTRYRRRQAELLEERAERAEREREEQARMAVLEERGRIAREIHDVVAHSVGVIAVQAGAGRRVVDQHPEEAQEALGAIEEVSRNAMTELRRLLVVLREPTDAASLVPQPGLARVPELVEQVRRAGLAVDLTEEGARPDLPPGLDLSAYRVVQEALTNTLRHAEASAAMVRVRYTAGRLEIEVTDDGGRTGAAASLNGQEGGQGLVGMRERVVMFGGTLHAGSTSHGFEVRATFPLPAGGGAS
jgi:signal transduction histidine kinase